MWKRQIVGDFDDDTLLKRKLKGIFENHPFWPRPEAGGRNAYGYKVASRK